MKCFILTAIFLLNTFLLNVNKVFSQNFIPDTSSALSSLHTAISVYHQTLAPETGLYNGSEYAYNTYYPFVFNEGHPFFLSKNFETGSVFYNNMLYENVLLLYDVVKEELLTQAPDRTHIIELNEKKISWFKIADQAFVKLNHDSTGNEILRSGFYAVLYSGSISLYKKVEKTIREKSSISIGINKYVVENDEYFIRKNDLYFKVKNKKSILSLLKDHKKEVTKFIKKNDLDLRKNKEDAFTKIVTYYDGLSNKNFKTVN